jgi:MFS family permease
MVAYEDAPLTRFHIRTTLAGTGGKFSDGFIHGIIGIVVAAAVTTLPPTPLWIGLLGTGTLTGLFFGAVIVGSIADRIGRRTSTGRRSACDVVRVADVPIPSPAAGQVRVKVAATSVKSQ